MSYRFLLVDDEKYVRAWLKNCINWDAEGFTLAGEATNGEDALELIDNLHPDLVISDMEMPRLNGNGLMQTAREQFPDTCFVVVSGYSDFEYLRGAIKNDALDYLLKPIKAEDLREVLARVRTRLESRRSDREQTAQAGTENEALRLERLAIKLISGLAAPDDLADMELLYWRVAVIDCAQGQVSSVRNELLSATNRVGLCCLVLELAGALVCLLGAMSEFSAISLLKTLPSEMLFCGLSQAAKTEQLPFAYAQAVRAVKIPEWEITPRCREFQMLEAGAKDPVSFSQEQRLLAALRQCESEEAHSVIYTVFSSAVREISPQGSAQAAYFRLVSILIHGGYEAGTSPEMLKESEAELYAQAGRFQKPDALRQTVEALADKLISAIAANNDVRADPARLAQDYIRKHYARDLALEEIARHAGVSPSYLCTIFKSDMQQSVVDFITQTRIGHAMEVLRREDAKIYEIAEAVGIPEPKYFCRVFKKVTGISPNEYRQKYAERQN